MSDEEVPALIPEKQYLRDWGNDVNQALANFKREGMPGIGRIRPEDMFRMREMYLGGSSYGAIAMTFNVKKVMVVFLSEKEGWWKEKQEKAEMIVETLSQNYNYVKADNELFVTELIDFWKGYYREKVASYRKSKDPSIVENMDLKGLEKLFKALEIWDKMKTKDDPKNPSSPLVNINMGTGSLTDNGNSITLDANAAEKLDSSKVLELLAELKRQQDLASEPNK